MYCVGKFEDRNGVAVEAFPQKWANEDGTCFWPPKNKQATCIRNQADPRPEWSLCPVTLLGTNYATFDSAWQKAKMGVDKSDLESDYDNVDSRLRIRAKPRCTDNENFNQLRSSSTTLVPPKFPGFKLAEMSGTQSRSDEDDSSSDGGNLSSKEHTPQQNIGHDNVNFGENSPVSDQIDSSENSPAPDTVDDVENSAIPNLIGNPDNDIPFLLMGILEETKRIKGQIKILGQDLKLVKLTLTNLDRKIDSISCVNSTPSGSLDLVPKPFSDLETFKQFDAGLNEDESLIMVNKIKRSGGSSTADAVGRMMRKLITDELGTKISLKGFKGNFNFSGTSSFKCIVGACLSLPAINATEKNIEHAIGEWFRHAGDRVKSSEKRATKNTN